ncbi:MAG: hypothetical protein IID54_06970, partial [Proteobacteria bacterium]|nr:hypothetical protein [Pseudomonadota bacterium]
LNLGQAVLIIAYEWFQAGLDEPEVQVGKPLEPAATRDDLHRMFAHLEGELDAKGYFEPKHKRPHMVRNLRTMLLRAHFTENEVRAYLHYTIGAPGSGGNELSSALIVVSRPDGLTLGTFVTGLIYTQLMERDGIRFDLREMSWIGSMSEEGRSLTVSNSSGLNSVEDLFDTDEPLLLATSGVGSSNHIEARIMIYALDLNVRLIPNMQAAETEMSMIRGEVDGVLGSASSLDQFVRAGHGKYVLSVAGVHSVLPGVPQASEFVRREDARPLLALIEIMAVIGRLTAGPPGIPEGRLAVLRRAYDAAARDPELLADAERLRLPIDPTTGAEVAERVRTLLNQPPEIVALLKRAEADR